MHALFWLIDSALSLFVWALIIGAIVSVLISFNVLYTLNREVWAIADLFHRLTEPAFRPIR
ncbi:MAG: YggT family protein, partial [bacterium]